MANTKVNQMKAQIVAGISNKGFALQSVIVFDEEVINEWKASFANPKSGNSTMKTS